MSTVSGRWYSPVVVSYGLAVSWSLVKLLYLSDQLALLNYVASTILIMNAIFSITLYLHL